MMFKLPLILACAIFPAHMACAAEADKYSVIPEPEKTELQHNSTRTLKLLSDQEAPSLETDAYRLTVTPQGAHLASGGREGKIYGLATLRQLRDQLAGQPEGIPCGIISRRMHFSRCYVYRLLDQACDRLCQMEEARLGLKKNEK